MSKKRIVSAVLALAFIAVVVAGCGYDYSGVDSTFTLQATIRSVGHRSVTVSQFTVVSANGRADGWFDHGSHQIHNNYTDGFHMHTIGHVYDSSGNEISLGELRSGDQVTIEGSIRANDEGKYTYYRPVYDRIVLNGRD